MTEILCHKLYRKEMWSTDVCSLFPFIIIFQEFRSTELQNHRMVQAGGHLVQHPCSNRAIYSTFSIIVYRWLLGISKDKDSTTSLETPCQCSATLTEKIVFSDIQTTPFLLCFLCPEPLVCHWALLKKSGFLIFVPFLQVFIYIDKIPP